MEIALKGKSVKDIEQQMAFQSYVKDNCRGAIIAGTGFGKSRVGVMGAIDALDCDPILDALILVPFDHLKDRFKDEFEKCGHKDRLPRVQMECYASIPKLVASGKKFSIIVADEVHLGLTEKCCDFYDLFPNTRMMFLTATEPEEHSYKLRLYKYVMKSYNISLDDCVAKGLVAPYHITCIGLGLTSEEDKTYKTVNKNFGYWKSKLGFDAFNAAGSILRNAKAYSKDDVKAAVGFFRAIRQRKDIVDTAHNKVELTNRVLGYIGDQRALVFGGSVKFTETLAASVEDSQMYHSKNGVKKNKAALLDFKSGVCKRLFSVKALNQGLDIPDAAVGIICGLTSKSLTMIQRVGRLIRINPSDPKKSGQVYILYVKDSQEEKWLRNALGSTDPNTITWKKDA
jgi:superfamily II DNA or RNA helicase